MSDDNYSNATVQLMWFKTACTACLIVFLPISLILDMVCAS